MMLGVVTVNGAEIIGTPVDPAAITIMNLTPGAVAGGMTTVVVNEPPLTVTLVANNSSVGLPSTMPLPFRSSHISTLVTADGMPDPETLTLVFGGPWFGVRVIVGTASAGVMSRRIGVARSSAVAIAAVDALVLGIFPFIAICEVLLVYNLLLSRGVTCF
jgi:hypothetical protein